ncbi:MAG: hypothetical protein QOE79_1804 [Sphingomonadales bacterium]|jgi:hypothetical protein|nr:hypothetical protein [Sphingomonadales bacterium]MEA3050082.1 hypothetical protein [Sphingomonadales bacterium]
MAKIEEQGSTTPGGKRRRAGGIARGVSTGRFTSVQAAKRAGLLEGEASEHLSFRAPKGLVEAAKRESGLTSPTDLGIVALSMLAEPDPVVAFLRRTRGALGEDAELDY